MKQEIKLGKTDYSAFILIRDTAGAAKTGLTAASAGMDVSYARMETDNDCVVAGALALTALATPALTDPHLDWGFIEVDATKHPGLYRLDIADEVFAADAWAAVVTVIGTGLDPTQIEYILVANDMLDGVSYGLTALPNAAAGAADGLVIGSAANKLAVDANGKVAVPDTQKVDVETIKTRAVTCAAGVTVRADVGAAAAPGAANGMLIGGANAATTFDALTVTNATTLTGAVSLGSTLQVVGATTFTGNVAMSATFTISGLASMTKGLQISNSTVNGPGISVTGNGTGQGIMITGGGTSASGVAIVGGAPNGVGFYIQGDGVGPGLRVDGGDGDGPGAIIQATSTDANGITITGAGTGHGISVSSGAGATGNGLHIAAASTNGFGASINGAGAGEGLICTGGLTGSGAEFLGGGTSGHGIYAKAAATGHGISANGGGVAGDGLHAEADNDGDGIQGVAAGAGTFDLATDEVASIETKIDAIKVITDALTAASAAKLATSAGTMVTGTVSHDNTIATTTVFYCDDITEATADHFNGRIVIFTSGDLQYQATDITDYELVAGEGKFTVTALTELPADNVTFIIV